MHAIDNQKLPYVYLNKPLRRTTTIIQYMKIKRVEGTGGSSYM